MPFGATLKENVSFPQWLALIRVNGSIWFPQRLHTNSCLCPFWSYPSQKQASWRSPVAQTSALPHEVLQKIEFESIRWNPGGIQCFHPGAYIARFQFWCSWVQQEAYNSWIICVITHDLHSMNPTSNKVDSSPHRLLVDLHLSLCIWCSSPLKVMWIFPLKKSKASHMILLVTSTLDLSMLH